MNKCIRQCNLQHRVEPKHPLTFGPPQLMDANVKPSQLTTKEAHLADDDLSANIDDRDAELSNVLSSIETIDDDSLRIGSAEINEGCASRNQDSTC